MQLPEICIKRPVFAVVINVLLVIIGLVGFERLAVRQLPVTEQFVANIETVYLGASADLIEEEITTRIENRLTGVEGIDAILSNSYEGASDITIRFQPNYDIGEGLNDVRDQLSAVRGFMPEDAEDPILSKADPNTSPTIFIGFNDEKRSALELTDYIERYVRADFEQIQGVARVQVFGRRDYSVRVWLDPAKMAARNVTADDIATMLEEQNQTLPGGSIESTTRDYPISTDTKLKHVDEFQHLIIRDENGSLIRLSDVANIEMGALEDDNAVYINGNAAIILALIPQATANPVDISREANKRLEIINRNLPQGMRAGVAYDEALFIDESIKQVYKTILEAIALVVLVVFGFLGSIRSTIIPIITIPLCLGATFGVIYFLGYTINTMTLLALVLAIGLVVDDAIVMLENVFRHIEEGLKPVAAAIKGSTEIAFAIVAMTITLAAVYAPIGFTKGLTGDIFREFAFTLAGAVLISGFVALTLSPMMCAYLLKPVGSLNRYQQRLEHGFESLFKKYRQFLYFALGKRYWVVGIFLIVAVIGVGLFTTLKQELAPIEDSGAILTVLAAPTGSSFSYTEEHIAQAVKVLEQIPENSGIVSVAGFPTPTQGIIFTLLKDWGDRDRSQSEIINSIQMQLISIPGIRAFALDLPPVSSSGGDNPIEMVVQISGSYADLGNVMDNLVAQLEKYPGLNSVESSLKMDSQQIAVSIDRELAANLGITPEEINDTINIMVAGRNITNLDMAGESYEVMVQMPEINRQAPSQLQSVYVRARDGTMVPLSSLVTAKSVVKADSLPHYNRLRSATLTANLNPGYSMGEAVEYIETLAPQVLPETAKYTWEGLTRDYTTSSGEMIFTVILALVFIYLALAAQFESFADPLVIMLTVPFSILGAVLLLHITGGTNNLYTQIGFVTLIGLITKHGILITEFANSLQREGKAFYESIVEASVMRIRPILMTTGATALGALPLAIATGAGAVSRQQMGWVIVGGMIIGTLFSLLVVPIAYSFLSRKKSWE
ncbi:MAG: efflux RND transporter permease subunit [Legionellales bacterium]